MFLKFGLSVYYQNHHVILAVLPMVRLPSFPHSPGDATSGRGGGWGRYRPANATVLLPVHSISRIRPSNTLSSTNPLPPPRPLHDQPPGPARPIFILLQYELSHIVVVSVSPWRWRGRRHWRCGAGGCVRAIRGSGSTTWPPPSRMGSPSVLSFTGEMGIRRILCVLKGPLNQFYIYPMLELYL